MPSVLPHSPLGDTSPRVSLNTPLTDDVVSILQGTLTDILQEPSGDDSSTNSTVIDPDVFRENKSQQGEPPQPGTGVPNTALTSQQLPEVSQPQPTKDRDSITQPEEKEISPTKTNQEKPSEDTVQTSGHTADGNHDSGRVSVQHKYSPDSESLQPSATTITSSTVSRPAGRGAHRFTPTVTSVSSVLPAVQDTNTESRPSHNSPPPPPITYLPVGAPPYQYPTAPLLQLPQEPNSYPA